MLLPFADRDIPNLEQIMHYIKLPLIDPAQVSREIEDWMVSQTLDANRRGAIIGLSGGVDSSTVACLAKSGFDRYNLTHTTDKHLSVFGAILPSKINPLADTTDGERVAQFLGIDYKVISIEEAAESFRSILPGVIESEFDRGNLYSEVRAITLSRLAASQNLLIFGTGNRDEDYHLGYFTKRGDGAVDKSPIGDLAKRHVRQIAAYNALPSDLVMRTSTAGLWANQTDEKELGFAYLEAEIVIEGKDQGYSRDDIQEITKFGYCCNEKKSGVLIVDEVLRLHQLAPHKLNPPAMCKIVGKKYVNHF